MDQNWIFILIASGVGFVLLRFAVRRLRSYRWYLASELAERGYELVASNPAPLFSTGPFRGKAIEVEFGRPQLKTPLGSGSYTAYRRVTYRDAQGEERESWAKLDFEMFQLRRIIWQPGLKSKKQSR